MVESAGQDKGQELVIEVVDSLSQVDKAEWDACAGVNNPFVSYDFLAALENSKSAVAETGWLAQHVLLKKPKQDQSEEILLGAVPLYLKNHSQGEYVFDHAWADAFERAGGSYYPKLQSAVPFSPVTGPRLLVNPNNHGIPLETLRATLADALLRVGKRHRVSNLHVTFCDETEIPTFNEAGYLLRYGHQFHWHNQDFRCFQDFLDALTSNKRKAIRKEREKVSKSGVKIEVLSGGDIKAHHWDAFFDFYMDTGSRKWGTPYLSREFFDEIHQTMAERVALVMGTEDDTPVCGALNMLGEDTIYGRNWGCSAYHKHLHFEACYYQAIEFAIEKRLRTVEAGAQGYHKLQRGYLPTLTYSAHFLFHDGFAKAIDGYLKQERQAVLEDLKLMQAESPFRESPALKAAPTVDV